MSEPSPTAQARDMELVPTRRMPSDAVAALWLEEVEGLDGGMLFASRPCGAPAGAQRSGSGGERRRSGMSESRPAGRREGYGACADEEGMESREYLS